MKCEICKKEIEKSAYGHAVLCDSKECFTKHFWKKIIDNKDDFVIINHTSYQIGDEGRTVFRGFNGNEFKIKFNNGNVVKTTNLWTQGDIPKKYWIDLPDNAKFIN